MSRRDAGEEPRRWKILVASCFLFCVANTPLALRADEVTIGTGEYLPYTTSTLPNQGCALEIVKSAFAAEGWHVNFRFMPWPRNLKVLSEGEIDASAFWNDRPDRRSEYFFPKNPLTMAEYRFIFRQDTALEWNDISDLAGKSILLNRSYTYTEEFINDLVKYNIQVREIETDDLNLKLLLRGRGDLTVMDEKVMDIFLNQLSPEDRSRLVIDNNKNLVNSGYLIFSKNNLERSRKLAEIFDRGFEKIEADRDMEAYFRTCGIGPD
jgi:polar amino acid transport system substrate-binding protein